MSEFTRALDTLSKSFERGETEEIREACYDLGDTTLGTELFEHSEVETLCGFLLF